MTIEELEAIVKRERRKMEAREAEAKAAGGMYDPVLKRWVEWDANGPK